MTTQAAIQLGNYTFEGPFTNTASLRNESGVYVILCSGESSYGLIDVGEASDVKSRVENHDRAECWKRNCNTQLSVAVLYTPGLSQAERRAIETQIRAQYGPPCGEQ